VSTLSTPDLPSPQARGEEGPEPAGDPPPAAVPSPGRARRERALLLVTLVLILAASAAFLRAQTLKLEPSALKRPRIEKVFSPVCGCEDKATASLSFGLRRASLLDARMIDSDARIVRTLADGAERPAGRLRLEWDGRDDVGRLQPDGPYRLRLFLDEEREVVVPRPVVLDTQAPRAALISVAPRTIVVPARKRQRGRGRGSSRPADRAAPIDVRYRSSEAGRATLLVDGLAAMRTGRRLPGRRLLRWDGRLDGRPLRPGSQELALRVRDRAGNSSAPTRSVTVRVGRSRDRR
jgi:hypothetical protein